MASSTSLIDLIAQSQSSKEVTANDALNSASQAMLFARRGAQSSGLVFAYYGGQIAVDGVQTAIANGSVTLTASSGTNYIEATRGGVVSKNTTGFTAGAIPLYTAVAGATTISAWTDIRPWTQPQHITSIAQGVVVTTTDVTLTQAQAACQYLPVTGALTGNRNVIVPNNWQGIVFCNNSGAFTTTFKTAGGSGIVVAQGKRALLLADGTNVVRVTPDT